MTRAEFVPGIWSILPAGDRLPDASWDKRHRAILTILWLHVPALAIFGTVTGHGFWHSLTEAGIVATLAVGGSLSRLTRVQRAAGTTVGLVVSSAILVHFSEGLIEMHFHFFVMVAVVTLYQAWTPFLLAIAFVVLHHGTIGILSASSVYNHAAAIENPWRWAVIHGLFIAGASAAGLTAWKLNEIGLDGEREALHDLEHANSELAEAQSLAHVGSWEWTVSTGAVWWSDELYRIAGVSQEDFVPSVEGFMSLVDPDDRDRVRRLIETRATRGENFDYETQLVRADGSVCRIHCLGKVVLAPYGSTSRMRGTVQDITERKALEERIAHQAFHDSLTDLANRTLFLDRIDHALARQERQQSSTAVIFFDLDDFKSVNDSLGHEAGDELLVQVARRLGGLLRPGDTVARFGGDEFAVLLEDVENIDHVLKVAERVLQEIEQPFNINGIELFIDASIGIALNLHDIRIGAEELVSQADTAMYVAKRKGKGTVEIFAAAMQEKAAARVALRADLQRAIDNEEFTLDYQPIVAMDSGRVVGVEALVRWEHPQRGPLAPMEFIPFAEETGLILPIGDWVVREACRAAASWQPQPGSFPLSVAVNVSAVRFRHEGFVQELTEILAETGLEPGRLVLEITESLLVQDAQQVAQRLAELKELGVRLAVDDFGTGYSSLSYLHDFPLDILKVDKVFIDSVTESAEESALARAIIKLGHTLGLQVIAEGVEDAAQAAALGLLDCDLAQGYLFARPAPFQELEKFLNRSLISA